MSLNARKIKNAGTGTGSKQEPIEAGTYPARVAQIIDLGLQNQRPYKGTEKPPANELMLTYELVDEFCLDENGVEDESKPRWLSETLPLRSLEAEGAKSTQRYYALDPKEDFGGDFVELAGLPANVTIVQNAGKGANAGKIYNNVESLSPMRSRDAAKTEELKNPTKVFVLDDPDMEVFGSLPEWIQDKIKGNLEFKGSKLDALLNGGSVSEPEPEEESDEEDDGLV